jgi:hypothetical protein
MNDAWIVILAFVSIVAIACGALAYAWTRGRLGVASGVLLVLALAAWVADFAAVSSGFHDADGFVDCGSACTPTHRLAALGLFMPPLLIAIAAAGMAFALLVRGRRRRLPMSQNRG